jgi:cobalt-precorrin 5A hydrolase
MGSDVVEGFACKPEALDRDKPIMFAAAQIFICDGERCGDCHCEDVAAKVRETIREMGLHKGPCRIKVTRTGCNGACRYGAFAFAYQNANANSFHRVSSFSAWKNVHLWTSVQWRALITSLVEGRRPESLREFAVEDKIYD